MYQLAYPPANSVGAILSHMTISSQVRALVKLRLFFKRTTYIKLIASSEENGELSRNVKYFFVEKIWNTKVQKLIQFICFVRIVHDVYCLVQTLKYQSTV